MFKKIDRFVFLFCLLLPSICFADYQSTFTPWISAGEEYTDNLFLTDRDAETEWITTITPGIRYNFIGKTGKIGLSYAPTFVSYDKHTDFNTVRHNASVDAGLQLTKHTKFTVRNVFVETEEPINREDPLDETIRRSREPYYTNTATAAITHQFGSSDMISLRYRDTLRDHENPLEENSKSHGGSVNLMYWFLPRLGIDTGVDYTRGDFSEGSDDFDRWGGHIKLIQKLSPRLDAFIKYTHTDMDYLRSTSDYQVHDGTIGMGYEIEEDTQLSISVGYLVRDRERGNDEERTIANIDLDKAWDFKRSSIKFKATSGYKETYFGAENLGFDIYWRLLASARYYFSKQFSGNISGDYRRDKYTDIGNNRKDYTGIGAASLNYQPCPWLSTALQYIYRDRDSNIDTNDYEENSVILTITLTPTHPIRF